VLVPPCLERHRRGASASFKHVFSLLLAFSFSLRKDVTVTSCLICVSLFSPAECPRRRHQEDAVRNALLPQAVRGEDGRVGTCHQLMTASMVRVTNLTPPGVTTLPSRAYGHTHQLVTAGMVHVTNLTPRSDNPTRWTLKRTPRSPVPFTRSARTTTRWGWSNIFVVFGSCAVDAPVDDSQYGPRNQSDTPGSE
jgi:hypothetical protein